jgi:hypothetical protein
MNDSSPTVARYVDCLVRVWTKATRMAHGETNGRAVRGISGTARRTHKDDAPKVTRCFDRNREDE